MRILILAVCLVMLTVAHAGAQCLGDFNGDGKVTINEIIVTVDNSLNGCQVGGGGRFVDNGDGTVTDQRTRLQWEKLDFSLGIHSVKDEYTWNAAMAVKVATLNSTNFGGHNDWRLPAISELVGIVDFTALNPAVDPAFNTACEIPCTSDTCSCTDIYHSYWSATDAQMSPTAAWDATFAQGFIGTMPKSFLGMVRAVRGGS